MNGFFGIGGLLFITLLSDSDGFIAMGGLTGIFDCSSVSTVLVLSLLNVSPVVISEYDGLFSNGSEVVDSDNNGFD